MLCARRQHRRSTISTCTLLVVSIFNPRLVPIWKKYALRPLSTFSAAARSDGDVENFRWQLRQMNWAILIFGTCWAP